ncbi:DUF4435 domain-containing protein [Klebsiella aerogenes]|uniref:DUF4435 domain-containing protein n=1 Tax=Klebsiella aerogenes TaxID=548 RepID=UPI00063C770F|nr:DUF4435 domain-containing protein [Klebsiella aerogenes]KLF55871.1 hypothetical protein YA35_09515 [Klebsiella aerogenes]MDU9139630.1 DUF4435 domain-containing protein [Klebsiella aerogenes]MDX7184541.1 DUF4435 domain-containing protein [Klebsiella aerogenes]HCT8366621.1 DUF4435 domain-containing protein [Klebsiella aerogenes]
MLERGLAARKAKSVFFEERNSIDIYIEDTAVGYRKIYKCILNRVLGDKFLINDVFPLGGKKAVLQSWGNDRNKRNRPQLHIVDGDIELLSGERRCDSGLYTLPYYCIENIFLCEQSLLDILVEEDPEKERDELSDAFNFTEWNRLNIEPLINLFVTYYLVKKYVPTIPSIHYQVSRLVTDNSGIVDAVKVKSRINELEIEIINVIGQDVLNIEKERIYRMIDGEYDIKKYISGKDYLLPLIVTRMKSIVNTKVSNITLKHRISQRCSLEDLSDIENFIFYP